MKAWILVALAACYADVRPGFSAPVSHGHGGVGFDVGFGGGVEHASDSYRAGGGLMLGARASDGLQKRFGSEETAPDGTVAQLFAGLGYGTTRPDHDTGHVAFGYPPLDSGPTVAMRFGFSAARSSCRIRSTADTRSRLAHLASPLRQLCALDL